MKSLLNIVKNKYKRLSMSTKLTVSFSAPVTVLFLILFSIGYSKIYHNYSRQVLNLANQSFVQATDFLNNTIDYMTYVSDQIYYNGDLQRILTSDQFHGNREIGDQYREYLVLDKIFFSAEMSDTIFRTGIYIPDDLIYSSNGYHFMKDTELLGRSDYEEFVKSTINNQYFFTTSEIVQFAGLNQSVQIVSMLREVRSTDGDFKSLCVEQVSIRISDILSIIENADITKAGLVYLINDRGEIISSSNEPMITKLQETNSLPNHNNSLEWWEWSANGNKYLVNSKSIPDAAWHLIAIIPESEMNRESRNMSILFSVISILVIVEVCIISYLLAGHYVKRLNNLNLTIHQIQKGDFDVSLSLSYGDEIDELSNNFYHMAEQLKHLMEEQYESGRAVQSAEMRALQAQINPHFLYNTLDLINWEAYDYNAFEISEIAQSLAQFYRISLNKGINVITIEEELNHVRAYVKIENFHFSGAIHLEIDVPQEIQELSCINIILQPFVENAIMHGIAENASIHECNILISARMDEKNVWFYIKDDGIGMNEEQIESIFTKNTYKNNNGYGVKNINSRLKLCYGEEYGVKFESVHGEGTTAILNVPIMTMEEAEVKVLR